MKNPYKNTEIFRCIHESHRGFKNKISVYHILKEKSCFPNGCIYFHWKCKQLSKKSKCHRGFSYVWRKCTSCKDFYEEKIHNFPELQISSQEFQDFMKELRHFEDWLEEVQYKWIEFAGRVVKIKPHFRQKIYPKASFLSFCGYLIILTPAFLEWERFEDPVYAYISGKYLQQLKLGNGAEIEGMGQLGIDRGRVVMKRMKNIEVTEAGKETFWNEQKVLLSKETATEFPTQPEGCVGCEFGALVDVEYKRDHHSYPRRKLFCLKGIADFRDCYIRTEYCGMDNEAHTTADVDCTKRNNLVFS